MPLFLVAIFLSAFLLFQVQPLIGRYLLPWFGGTPAVWTTCLLTFQLLLVAGYLYAHFSIVRLKPRQQVFLHLILITLSLILLPVAPRSAFTTSDNPTLEVMFILLSTAGLPYVILSATTPLLQHWFQTVLDRDGYRLYAVSNAGSLVGLLAYPFAVEPVLRLERQSVTWSIAYVLAMILIMLCGLLIVRRHESRFAASRRSMTSQHGSAHVISKTPVFDRVMWLLLSACGSALLMVTSGQMLQNVASVPLLWILPLVAYLLSFVICFGWPGFYRRWIFFPAYVLAVFTAFATLYGPLSIASQLTAYMAVLCAGCCICHGELFHSKPPAEKLSQFYLALSVGGAVGGAASALVAPLIFADHQGDFLATVFFIGVLLTLQARRRRWESLEGQRLRVMVRMQSCAFAVVATVAVIIAAVMPTRAAVVAKSKLIAHRRNFYGSVQIFENAGKRNVLPHRLMVHGNTMHGVQLLDKRFRTKPTSYFSNNSGAGRVLALLQDHHREMRIGVIGLGVGTLASYGRAGDEFIFFELDENVIELCEQHFSYLRDARARGVQISILPGDGRINLEQLMARNRDQKFDLLVIDAFSGNAVPCHLLTTECADIYWRHMQNGGVLLFNVTNRYVDLAPVVKGIANASGKSALLVEYHPEQQTRLDEVDYLSGMHSRWIIVTDSDVVLEHESIRSNGQSLDGVEPITWTDDYQSVLRVLR